jgi:hypothetical protein
MCDRKRPWRTGRVVALLVASLGGPAFAQTDPSVPVVSLEAVLEHEPIEKSASGHPIPIYATTSDIRVAFADLHYRTGRRWKKKRMKRKKDVFEATLECDELDDARTVSYYIEALDDFEKVLDGVGSEASPIEIRIRGSRPVLHLPGDAPPRACKSARSARAPDGAPCEGEDCDGSTNAREEPPSEPWLWLSASVMQDAQIATGSDVCSPSSQQSGSYTCLRANGSHYFGTPLPGQGGDAGGFELATTRLLAGLDMKVAEPLTLGVRAGYAFGGGPPPASSRPFLPLHAEGRLAYWLSNGAYADSGFEPYLVAAGGVGQVDSMAQASVTEDRSVPPPPNQLNNPDAQRLDAWKKSGVGFASLGAGAFVALGRRHGFLFEARGAFLFPTSGVALSLAVGYAVAP